MEKHIFFKRTGREKEDIDILLRKRLLISIWYLGGCQFYEDKAEWVRSDKIDEVGKMPYEERLKLVKKNQEKGLRLNIEQQTRKSLNRMFKNGLIFKEKKGKYNFYKITQQGIRIIIATKPYLDVKLPLRPQDWEQTIEKIEEAIKRIKELNFS